MGERSSKLKEFMAEQCHRSWSGWMKHLFSRSAINSGSISRFVSLEILRDDVERWQRQIDTQYSDLSDKEKVSDLKEADEYLYKIIVYIRRHGIEELIGNLADVAWDLGDKNLSKKLHDARARIER